MPTCIRGTFVTLIGLLIAGCGGAPAMPTEPVSLTGSWSGVIGQGSGGGRALRVTWTATQTGNTATGPVSVLTSPPVTDVIFSGVMTGTISGTQVSLTLSSQPLPGSECSLTGTGSANGGTGSGNLSGTLDVRFSPSCGALEPPANDGFVLAKQ
jgi:hypothetical protein